MRVYRSVVERYGYAFAVVCIAASTAVFLLGRGYFAKGQWALLYLLIIGLVAGLSGVRPALLAAVLAFFTWNYFFLPPFHTFVVEDPKDWLSLFAFLIVGIAVGLQTGRMREREAEALDREREMSLLNEFSAHLVSDTTVSDMADLLIREVKRTTGASCVALLLPGKSGTLEEVRPSLDVCEPSRAVLDTADWARRESKAIGLPVPSAKSRIAGGGWPVSVAPESIGMGAEGGEVFIPLQTASRQEGVLYVGKRGDGRPYSLRDAQLLVAVANQSAAFLERKHLQAIAVKADALQEADKLKSTLVSSVSHELKTPLASVTATVSNLLEQDVEWNESRVHDELEAIQDDLQRLNNSIGALLDLSRLEASAWEPKKDLYEFGEILGTAISKIPQKQRNRISYDLPDDLPTINVDFPQWARALQNLLENALFYSSEASPVRVGASHTSSEVRMWVEDEGPGIPTEDKERIFEKFYRGETSGRVPSGTGLGLAVTREIVRFHGGRLWVEDVVPHGARLVISLPKGNP
jgi:two-component system sensor histidine kinase KdpD